MRSKSLQGHTQLDESVLITTFWPEKAAKDQSTPTETMDVKKGSPGEPSHIITIFFLLIHRLVK